MSLAIVHSRSLVALQARPVQVEVHLANGLPSFTVVGLADTEVKESRERVRSAIQSSGLAFPHNKRITVNLAPADLPKESGRFDLPMALGILAAAGEIDAALLEGHEVAGELSLAGALRGVRGAVAFALALAGEANPRTLVLPACSASAAAQVRGVDVRGAEHLMDVVAAFRPGPERRELARATPPVDAAAAAATLPDLRDVKGHAQAKRALEIAAAGGHSLLMVGPPGSGKSMLAERLPSLLPPMDEHEQLAQAALLGLTAADAVPPVSRRRPLRSPHHTASAAALVGGGSPPRPGEISLAHGGVLFLDELPEFRRSALEALREPLENGRITISRAAQQASFPALFQLVAAMNPCPCGRLGTQPPAGSADPGCRCSPDQVQRYRGRLSGPLLDRIDLQIEVALVPPRALTAAADGEPSATVAARVLAARERQQRRQACVNARLPSSGIDEHAAVASAAERFLLEAVARLGWSGRALHRVLRVARTVADLAGSVNVELPHVAEAIQLRRPAL